jgi:hypothetical protein
MPDSHVCARLSDAPLNKASDILRDRIGFAPMMKI